MDGQSSRGAGLSHIGRSMPRFEARAKVTGRAQYVHQVLLAGMLHGKVLRSTVAHGRILRIDTAKAKAMPGVHAVVTGQDILAVIPKPYYGPAFHDQPILAIDEVSHWGQPVAAVLAKDPHVAARAAAAIEVEYEEWPAVYDEIEAATSSIAVHKELKPAATFADLKHLVGHKDTNLALDYRLRRGDTEKGFAEAAHIFEHTFRNQQCMHTALEPHVTVVDPQGDALVIHTCSQNPSFIRTEIARLLGWPENRVRVVVPFLGGGFGGKLYIKLEALVTALALIAGRPVKIVNTMKEEFYTITKHAVTVRLKTGVTADGRIIARDCEAWFNGGAFADIGPRVTQKAGYTAAGPYDIEHVRVDSYQVYTNRPPAGALRGFGVPQLAWAYESQMDMIAHELGMDPLEIRRQNILREGQTHACGAPLRDAPIDVVLQRIADRLDWKAPFDRGQGRYRRGRGLGIALKAGTAPATSVAMLNINAGGSVTVYVGTADMGQGSDTALGQIAAEALDLSMADVKVVHTDTDVTPYDMGTCSARSTFHMGNAIRAAADDAKGKLKALMAEMGLPEGSNYSVKDVLQMRFGMQAGNIIGYGSYVPPHVKPDLKTGLSPEVTPFWAAGGTGAEVEVDTETGHVRVLRLVNVADGGRIVNPEVAITQISGAAIMQLGFTMYENMMFKDGRVRNASLAHYEIPSYQDIPPMENELIEAEDKRGPFGAKGLGESGTFGVSPAIGNAIFDAVGIRLTDLPITAEAVLRALRAKAETSK
jgi:CO/xanthine dehydrogenase Mo-binding subunit